MLKYAPGVENIEAGTKWAPFHNLFLFLPRSFFILLQMLLVLSPIRFQAIILTSDGWLTHTCINRPWWSIIHHHLTPLYYTFESIPVSMINFVPKVHVVAPIEYCFQCRQRIVGTCQWRINSRYCIWLKNQISSYTLSHFYSTISPQRTYIDFRFVVSRDFFAVRTRTHQW